MPLHPLTVTKIECYPMDLPIRDPFIVATGQMDTTETLFVRVTLKNGQTGYGEMAPFHAISGETRESSVRAARDLAGYLLGKRVDHFRQLARAFDEMVPSHPSARCGMEMAVLDALCHALFLPMWALWGGAEVRPHATDITLPIADGEHTLALARQWYHQGFRLFKMKVGRDVESDIQRLESLHRTFPDLQFVVDPNQGYSREQAMTFGKGARRIGATILVYEQPLHRDDWEGQAKLRQELGIPLAADESVRGIEDLSTIIKYQAADFINIKIMKSGVIQALDIALVARALGFRLMIGGMVETRLAMGCSFSLVLGLGGFETLDLDTPLLLAEDPLGGGYQYQGPYLQPWEVPGIGIIMDWESPSLILE